MGKNNNSSYIIHAIAEHDNRYASPCASVHYDIVHNIMCIIIMILLWMVYRCTFVHISTTIIWARGFEFRGTTIQRLYLALVRAHKGCNPKSVLSTLCMEGLLMFNNTKFL